MSDFLSTNNQFYKNCRFFWWVEQIILPKYIFLPHFEIVQNFHYFVRSAPVDFLSKIQFSKKCLKCCRNVLLMSLILRRKMLPKNIFLPHFEFSLFCKCFNFPHLMSGTNYFAKNIFLPHFEIVQNFHFFVRSAPVWFSSQKFNFPKSVSNVVEMFLLMSGKILIICQNSTKFNKKVSQCLAKKYFLTPFWDSTKFSLFCKVRACRFSVKTFNFPILR